MRLAVTIARPHGAERFEFVTGPEVPVAEQHDAFKALRASQEHPEFAEVQIWESGRGRVKSQRFRAPEHSTGE